MIHGGAMIHHVTLGHNVRHWTTFAVTDLTPEEVEVLEGEDDAAATLFETIVNANRATEVEEEVDDAPTLFEEFDQPEVINIQEGS